MPRQDLAITITAIVETARAVVNDSALVAQLAEERGVSVKEWANSTLTELEAELGEAVWTAAFVNDLPDSSFAIVMPGGKKDDDGKTTPRSLRKLPYKDADGTIDAAHLNNALARVSQVKGASAAQIKAAQKALQAAKESLKPKEETEAENDAIRIISNDLFQKALDRVIDERGFTETDASLRDIASRIEDAFHALFSPADKWDGPYRVRDVFADHPTLGDAAVVFDRVNGGLVAVGYEQTNIGGYEFAPRNEWKPVRLTYAFLADATQPASPPPPVDDTEETVSAEAAAFSEALTAVGVSEASEDQITALIEALGDAGVELGKGRRAPVIVDFAVLQPGPGNKRDGNYYPASVVERDIHVFEGASIYVTDHNAAQRSEGTKVGRVRKCPTRFEETTKAPIAEAIIYDPDQAEKARNRADAGELSTLTCSIFGAGTAKAGVVDGQKYKIVQSITTGRFLELVSEPGAGGHAVALREANPGGDQMESQKPKTDNEDENLQEVEFQENEGEGEEHTVLAEADVTAALADASLPQAVKELLAEREYADADALASEITRMTEAFVEQTGSGMPVVQRSQVKTTRPSIAADKAKFEEAMDAVNARHLPGMG